MKKGEGGNAAVVAPAAGNTRGRLNPFAFPSDTDFRFWLLIVSVVSASLSVYESLLRDWILPAHLLGFNANLRLTCFEVIDAQIGACLRQNRTILLPWLLGGMISTLGLAFALYWILPAWKLNRRRLVPLQGADTAEICCFLAGLCTEAGLKRPPIFVWNPLNSARTGLAFGRLGRYYVALSGGLVTTFYTDQSSFRAVVLHELAHLRNGDVDKTYLTISIWQSFVTTALLPFTASRWHAPLNDSVALGWRVVALTLIVFTMRNAILRTREFYADVRASVWEGPLGALARVLSQLPENGKDRWFGWWTVHPRPSERCRTLSDDTSLFRMHIWDAFGTGVAGALAVPHVRTLLMETIESDSVILTGPPLILMTFVVYAIGLQIWRATFASIVRRVAVIRSDRLGFALAAGIFCGRWISFAGHHLSLSTNVGQIAGAVFWELALPGILMACFLRWIAAVAAAWLEVALERPSPRWIYRCNLLVAGLSFGAIYPGIELISDLAQRNVDMALLALVVFPVQFPLCLLVATVSWALPLASGLVRISARGAPVPAWVFLGGTHELEGLPPRPPMRFGTTLKIGAIGAVLSTCATVGALIAFRALPTLRKWVLSEGAGYLYSIGILVLAAVIAAITARAVAKRARRLPVFQGLFAAALTSWMAVSGMLAVKAWFDSTPITVDALLGNYTNLVDTGALASVFLLVGVPALGCGFRRLFGFASRRGRAGDPGGAAGVSWPRRIAFRVAVVVISAGAVSALYVQIRRAVEAVEAIDKKNAAAPALASNAAGSAAIPRMKAEGSTVLADTYLQMVRIPAGTFDMGSPQEEAGRDKDEGPVHRVTIPEFELGRTPVTRAQFSAFVRETGYAAGGDCRTVYRKEWVEETERWWREPGFSQDDSHPVVCVNWLDTQAYVDWLRRKTGQSWRLPSEAEWEYAARAGTTTVRFWGNDFDTACDFANVLDESGRGVVSASLGAVMAKCDDGYAYTAPVGHFRPNGFGLYDMLGNVWQAVQDCWHPSYESAPSDGSAWTSGECDKRVGRGGAWNTRASYVRSASRVRVVPEERAASAGFRVARSLPQGGEAAGNAQAWPRCTREDRRVISPDLQISGCPTVIQSGAETQGNLAIAFTNRCSARREQGELDRAIQDYDQAIRLQPTSALAFADRGDAWYGKKESNRKLGVCGAQGYD